MRKIETLEMALERIKELEAENQKLNEELEYYRNRKVSGRQKHNDKWQSIYNLNKAAIEAAAKKYGRSSSSNGWWIYPGTVLKLPG